MLQNWDDLNLQQFRRIGSLEGVRGVRYYNRGEDAV